MPLYLNYGEWEEQFQNLVYFTELRTLDNLVLIGDLNGRIGAEQNFTEGTIDNFNKSLVSCRRSKDTIVNSRGKKILDLFTNLGLVVLNGRTKGDNEGEFTFLGGMGSSVIDLAAVSVDCLSVVNDFKVISCPGSDHMPVEVSLRVLVENGIEGENDNVVLPLLPKLKWTKMTIYFTATKFIEPCSSFQIQRTTRKL